jgi:hypothetical protein
MEEIEGNPTSSYNSNKEISIWQTSDVKQFLQNNNLNYLTSKLEMKNIDGYDLCTLTSDDYKTLSITDIHDINTLKKLTHLKLLEESKYMYFFI